MKVIIFGTLLLFGTSMYSMNHAQPCKTCDIVSVRASLQNLSQFRASFERLKNSKANSKAYQALLADFIKVSEEQENICLRAKMGFPRFKYSRFKTELYNRMILIQRIEKLKPPTIPLRLQ